MIGVLLAGNFVVFGLVLRQLNRRTSGVSAAKNQSKTGKQQKAAAVSITTLPRQLKAAASITILLGLTWIFAVMGTETGTGNTVRLVFQYLFAVTVSTQGFLIFIVYCVRREEVRNEWLKVIKYQPKSADHNQPMLKMTDSGSDFPTTKTDVSKKSYATPPSTELICVEEFFLTTENQPSDDGINARFDVL